MGSYKKFAWITWENQRRSYELANALDCDFYLFGHAGSFRYFICLFRTMVVIARNRYQIIFVQNPSMVLAAFACLYKKISSKKIIVDRHSTFKINDRIDLSLNGIAYSILNEFTVKSADITIVTNKYLFNVVKRMGGTPFVLQDKLPYFRNTNEIHLDSKFNILMVCSFHKDEPIESVLKAVKMLDGQKFKLYVSGNYKKIDIKTRIDAPSNVVFTGFLDEQDYVDLVCGVDAIMVLTTADHTLLCGCYEAIAAGKPLITSNMNALVDYFKGCVYVDNTPEGISWGIMEVMNNYSKYSKNVLELKGKIEDEWNLKFKYLMEIING